MCCLPSPGSRYTPHHEATRSFIDEMSEFVFVCGDERSRDEGVELPTESDGNLLLAVLQSQFEGASGIKYKNAATGGWRAVKISDGVLCPPEGGWGSRSYVAVVTAGGSSKVDSEGGHEAFNAAPGGYNVPGSPVGECEDLSLSLSLYLALFYLFNLSFLSLYLFISFFLSF